MSSVAVFWDRDNTLIQDPGYISDPEQVAILPGAAEAVRRLSEAGFENVIITNQSGIARGMFDKRRRADPRSNGRLFAEAGARSMRSTTARTWPARRPRSRSTGRTATCASPSGHDSPACLERKIDLAGSWMSGDSLHDAQAGKAAGCRTIIIRGSSPGEGIRKGGDVDFLADSLAEARTSCLKYTRNRAGCHVAEDPGGCGPAGRRMPPRC